LILLIYFAKAKDLPKRNRAIFCRVINNLHHHLQATPDNIHRTV